MHTINKFLIIAVCVLASLAGSGKSRKNTFPYKQAGLTERQATAHLLSRFTFGIRPGQVDEVLKMGMEQWFNEQLDAQLPDDELNGRLKEYDALPLSNMQVAELYPRGGQLLRMAVDDGVISKDSVTENGRKAYKEVLKSYMEQKGLRPQQDLFRQLINQKILRAAYSNNQLQEVLTDFWFNHFNVALVKNDCAGFIPAYERDVIRPHTLGKFSDLLLSTAQSPAMLYYLDNFSSMVVDTGSVKRKNTPPRWREDNQPATNYMMEAVEPVPPAPAKKRTRGLNEN